MKKILSILSLLLIAQLLLPLNAKAQVDKNNLLINLGASSGYGYPNGLTSTSNSGIPTLNAHAEYHLHKLISLGVYGAYTYSFFEFDYLQYYYKDVWKGWDAGTRLTFHYASLFTKQPKIDLYITGFGGYTGRSLVYDESNIYRDDLNYSVDDFTIGLLAGVRYYVSKKFGFYLEPGISRKFFIGAGVSLSFPLKK